MSFTVYRSSAGSGKTFTLVREYLKIVLSDLPAYRHILAITFTNKAANEMKERIIHALELLSKPRNQEGLHPAGDLFEMMSADIGCSEAEVSDRARKALKMILHGYSDFAIGTIDSFSHRLIRSFAHDFGLPANFNVVLDTDELLASAVDLLLERVGDDAELTRLLVGFLEIRLEEEKAWNIADILTDFAKLLLDEEGQQQVRKLNHLTIRHFREISAHLHQQIATFEARVKTIAREACTLLDKDGIPATAFYQGFRGLPGYFLNLADGRLDKSDPNSYVKATIFEDKWFGSKTTPAEKEQIGQIKSQLVRTFEGLQEELTARKPLYVLRRMIAATIYPIAVLNEIGSVMDQFKRQNNLVHISEFNARIASIVMNEPVPFIYERLGDKYNHLLIDEFQDTSKLQWVNFLPLIENGLSAGYFSMVVGDGKQAIYRWRNGDVEQFNMLPDIPGSEFNPVLRSRQQVLAGHYKPVNLERNYRSNPVIVDFNNRFFRFIADRFLSGLSSNVYSDLEQSPAPVKSGGYIRFDLYDSDASDVPLETFNLEKIHEIILSLKEDNFQLHDIAILARSNLQAATVAAFLLENGIDVISAESLLVTNSPTVRFIIACLRYLHEPAHDIVKAEIRSGLLSWGASEPDPEKFLPGILGVLPVYDLCETIVSKLGKSGSADPYVRFFLDAVLAFSTKESLLVVDFLTWWEANSQKISIVVPEGINAVKVMTIHKSKGLQFPVVIFPFANESRKNTRDFVWVDLEPVVAPGLDTSIIRTSKEMESTQYMDHYLAERDKSMLDLVNLLYVAMTRPEKRLYVLTSIPSKTKVEPDSLPAFFVSFFEAENLLTQGATMVETGVKEKNLTVSEKPVTSVTLNELISTTRGRARIHIRTRAPRMWDINDPSGKSQWGSRVHTILSWINYSDDQEPALQKALHTGLAAVDELPGLRQSIAQVIDHPDIRHCFRHGAAIKTEAEILLPDGGFLRPDRVVIDGRKATVIDYKTGRPQPVHASQLSSYARCLEDMGFAPVSALLVYLHPEVNVIVV